MKRLVTLLVLLVATLFTFPSFAQEPTVTKTTWGALKTRFAQPVPTPAETVPTQTISSETGRAIVRPGAEMSAVQNTGYQAYRTDWQWDWKGPHFTIVFRIPHSTYGITRSAGIPTSCCEGGLNNWILARTNLGNGWDDCRLIIPKTLRIQYGYLTDWEFSRYFWLWTTYSY